MVILVLCFCASMVLQQLNKSLLKISEGLVHKTELKDFFSDLEEKVSLHNCVHWLHKPLQYYLLR